MAGWLKLTPEDRDKDQKNRGLKSLTLAQYKWVLFTNVKKLTNYLKFARSSHLDDNDTNSTIRKNGLTLIH